MSHSLIYLVDIADDNGPCIYSMINSKSDFEYDYNNCYMLAYPPFK